MQFRDYTSDPAPEEIQSDEPRLDEQDFGNVVALEHLNLEVPDLEIARLFYTEVLGLTPDPSRTGSQRGGAEVTWYNIGRQQLHICKGPAAQRLPPGGTIGLVLPSVEQVKSQAQAMRRLLGELPVAVLSPTSIQITDPNGVVFVIHQHYKGFFADMGIAYIHLPCFLGTSSLIAGFYTQTLGAPVQILGPPHPSTTNGVSCIISQDVDGQAEDRTLSSHEQASVNEAVVTRPVAHLARPAGMHHGIPAVRSQITDMVRAEVHLGVPGTKLVFYEEEALGPWTTQGVMQLFSGWHICFYISQFSHCYSRLRTLLFNTHPYKDKVQTFHDALRHHQYRFQDIVLLPPEGQLQLEGNADHGAIILKQTGGPIVASGNAAHPTPDNAAGGARSSSQAARAGSVSATQVDGAFALVPKAALPMSSITSLVPCDVDHVDKAGVPCVPGQLLYRISHEVRSLAHHNLLRPLYNREAGFK